MPAYLLLRERQVFNRIVLQSNAHENQGVIELGGAKLENTPERRSAIVNLRGTSN